MRSAIGCCLERVVRPPRVRIEIAPRKHLGPAITQLIDRIEICLNATIDDAHSNLPEIIPLDVLLMRGLFPSANQLAAKLRPSRTTKRKMQTMPISTIEVGGTEIREMPRLETREPTTMDSERCNIAVSARPNESELRHSLGRRASTANKIIPIEQEARAECDRLLPRACG